MSMGTTTAAGMPSGPRHSASTAGRGSSLPSRNPARTATPGQDWPATSMIPAATSMLSGVARPGTASTSAGASGGTESWCGLRWRPGGRVRVVRIGSAEPPGRAGPRVGKGDMRAGSGPAWAPDQYP